ncbi:MAG: 3-hydroxyacyl-CoA dehydrogenase family protein [Actinomycetes bacterium]
MLTSASTPIESVAVVGAGLMGRRIAGVMARAGFRAVLTDANADVLPAALADATAMCSGEVALSTDSDIASAVAGVDLVIEAIVENLEIKREVFAIMRAANPDAILATNSSVIPITAIASELADTSNCIGMHWWNPPDLIPIVEVIRGEGTSDAAMDRCVEALTRAGKLPVRVERDVPGFVGNRLQHALWREAIDLVASGVCDAETVDLVVRNTIGLRLAEMGPIENADYVGLDLTLAIHEQVLPSINSDPFPSAHLRELVAAGDLGAKTGSGFLDWPAGSREAAAARLSAHVSSQLSARQHTA